METFLYMDHTREDCVTALPNLVTGDFREKKITFGVLLREEIVYACF